MSKCIMNVKMNNIATAYDYDMLTSVCLDSTLNFTGEENHYAPTTALFGKNEPILGRLRC